MGTVACGQDKPAVTEPGTEEATEKATEKTTETGTDTESRDETAETETQVSDCSFDQMHIYSLGTSLNQEQSCMDAMSAIVLNDRCIYYVKDWGKGFVVPMKDRSDFSLLGSVGDDTAWIIKRQSQRTADGSARCYDFWMWKFDRETGLQVKSAFSLPIQNPPPFEDSNVILETFRFNMVDENTGYIFIFRWHWYDGYDLSFLAKTTDGGSNWTMIDPDPNRPGKNRKAYIDECRFLDKNRGMFISNGSGPTAKPEVAFTFDGGKTWSYIHLPWEDYNPNDNYCLEFDSYRYYAPTTNHEEKLFLVLKLPKNGEQVIFVSNDLKTWRLTDCIS